MAKKEKLQLDEFKLDDDLIFDFGVDDIDANVNPDVRKAKSRNPVIDVFKGTIEGAKDQIKSPSFIAKTVQDALPRQYGEVFTSIDKTTSSLSSLYDETIKEIKPELSRLAKKVDRLVPEESKFFKKLSTKFTELMGNEFKAYQQVSEEQLQEQGIASALADVFGAQEEVRSEEKAREASEGKIRDAIEQKRFTSSFGVLNSINQSVSRLSQYNDKINQAYQKKSLELQYRSFFVQSELLQSSNRFFEVAKNQNEAIARNTALPEFVKIKDSEKFKEIAKGKFFDSIQRGLFGDNNIFEVAAKRLKTRVKEQVSQFKQGMELGLMGLESIEAMAEQRRQMEEMGVDMGSKYNMLGNAAGGGLALSMGEKLAGKVRKALPEDSPIGRFGYKASDFLRNIPGYAEQARKSKFIKDNEYSSGKDGMLARLASFGLDLFRPELPEMRIKDSGDIKELDHPAIGFTNRALKSVTDVIPGYLARIYREITMMRTKATDAPLTMFDYNKDEFKLSTKLSTDVKAMLKSKIKQSMYGSSVEDAVKGLVGDSEVDVNSRQRLKNFMSQIANENVVYSPEGIKKSETYSKQTDETKRLLDFLLDKNITNSENKQKSQFKLTSSIGDIKKSTTDIRSEIELFIKAGYTDILEEQGLITRDKDGAIDINFEMYQKLLKEGSFNTDSRYGTSDINVKRNIKAINPKDALAAVKKTKIYDWFYKLGKGDQIPHTGPMAQDVKSNLGEEAAPGGTKIDLVNMNGVNMAAIQALQEEQSKSIKSDGSKSILQAIRKDTTAIVKLMSKGGTSIGGGSSVSLDNLKEILEARKGFFTSVVEPTIKGAFDGIGTLFGAAKTTGTFVKDRVATPFGNFISKAYSNNKDALKDVFQTMFKGAGDIIENIYAVGKDLLTNKIPGGLKTAFDMLKSAKDKIVDVLQGPMDIFVRGDTNTPILQANLMRLGHYIDATTGKVIRSIEDIKGPVKNQLGEYVLTLEQITKGLVDKDNKPIRTLFEKLATAAIGKVRAGFSRVKDFYQSIVNGAIPEKIKNLFTGIGGGISSSKSYDILVEIRDLLKAQTGQGSNSDSAPIEESATETSNQDDSSIANTEARYRTGGGLGNILNSGKKAYNTAKDKFQQAGGVEGLKTKAKGKKDELLSVANADGSRFSKLKGFGKSFRGGLGSIFGAATSVAGSMFGGDNSEQAKTTDQLPQELDQDQPQAKTTIIKTVKGLKDKAKAAWNDRDASGRRDGDWRDRLDALKERTEKNKVQPLKADLTARYRSTENVIDTIAKQAAGLMSGLSKGAGSVLESITDMVGMGGGGLLKKAGGLLKGLPGKVLGLGKGALGLLTKGGKGTIGLLGKGVGLVSKVGAPLARGISAAKNVAMVGRLATMGNVIRGGLALGSLATSGVASTIMGAGAIGLSALGSVLASPVFLGAAAIGATAYGAYKAYKYFTRDDVTVYDSIRIKQYGLLNSEKDKHHNHHLLQLEAYLQDGNVGYDRGKAYLLPKKIDMKEMLNIFDIDPEDTDMVNRYTEWFEYRFKPFFLTNVTALYAVNNKAKLSEVNKFSIEDRSKFLDLSSFESGPYDVQVSPFKDLNRLNTDVKVTKDMVTFVRNMHKEEIDKKSKKPKDQPQKTGFMTKQPVVDPNAKKGGEAYIIQPVREKLPNTNQAPGIQNASLITGQGEDGQQKQLMQTNFKSDNGQTSTAATKVTIADGPTRDGESAMQYMKIQPGVKLDGLNPTLLKQFKSMVQEYGETTGKSVIITSGYRDRATQEELYRKDPSKAAKPGRSLHEFGLALDVNSADLDAMDKAGLMRKYGFTRPVGGEPWHTEPAGIQVNLDKAKQDSMFANQAVEASLLKGGGGLGSIPGSPLRKRDTELALKIMGLRDVKTIKSDKDIANSVLQPGKIPETQESSDGQTFGTPERKSNIIEASFGTRKATPIYSGNVSTGGTPVGVGGGYAGSVAATANQTANYSKNDSLYDPESRPQVSSAEMNVKQPKNKSEVIKVIQDAASKANVDPKLLTAFAAVESGLNPNAKAGSSSASGLFQFTKATWQEQLGKHGNRYGLSPNASPFDPNANSLLASEYVKSNLKYISGVKPNPNLTDAYMAHFLGAGGARKFLRMLQTNPDANASIMFPSEARANPGVFMPGGRAMSVRQVYEQLSHKLTTKARAFGVEIPDTGMSAAGSMGNEPIVGSPLPNSDPQTSQATQVFGNSQNKQTQTVYGSQSSATNGFGSEPQQKQPSFGAPVMPAFPTAPSSGVGQGFNVGGLESGINHVGEILDKSLGVQTEMLTVLKDILTNVNPQNMQQVQEGLKQVATQAKPSAELSKPAIDLQRKSA